MHIIKVIRQLDKYEHLKKSAPNDPEISSKVAQKIPLFEKAIKKLLEKRATLEFNNLDKIRSPNPKKENTIAFNSTMNEYSNFGPVRGRFTSNNESFKVNKTAQNDSAFGSLNKMFDSIKTGNASRMSDKQYLNDAKLNELVNNSGLVSEKMSELQSKFNSLLNLN